MKTTDDKTAALEAPDAGVVAELVEAAKALKAIVEEIRGAMEHGTWRDGKGQRLKDTPEWVAFYNALALPAASAEDVRAGALAEACGKLHDLMCLPDGADLAIAKRWAAESRALIQEAKP